MSFYEKWKLVTVVSASVGEIKVGTYIYIHCMYIVNRQGVSQIEDFENMRHSTSALM